MIRFAHPEAFLLLLPLLLILPRLLCARALMAALRIGALLLLLAALAEPYRRGAHSGRDLLLLLDRSRSIGDLGTKVAEDWAARAVRNRRSGDRIGVMTFAADCVVEQAPREEFAFTAPVRVLDADATDLGKAIDSVLALIAPTRRGSILLVSDGENTGRDPLPSAREALRRGVRIDVVPIERRGTLDVAVEEIALPAEVGVGEPFQASAWVRSDRAIEAPFRLLRDGAVISEGVRAFRAGINRLLFRDLLGDAGVHRYELTIDAPDDLRRENDRARAVVLAGAPRRILVLSPGGREDRLTRSLRTAGLPVDVRTPENADLSNVALADTRAVILENVAARQLPPHGMETVATFVRDLGGGLWMTGGKASFGAGGYYRSPLEEVLPVSLEIRQEQRKFALAMAIALDRSGSMSMSVPSGELKMDLANRGAAAAVELLSPLDSVAIIAVDSSPHVVVPARPVDDPAGIVKRIRSIESMGGGIFIGEALHACAEQLADAAQANRHIVLFADASDSEEPTDYKSFVPKLRTAGVTVSVIGLGSDRDSDAKLLEEIAALGGGRYFFVSDAKDLPRVFAEETIQVAKSAVIEQPTPVELLPEVLAMADLNDTQIPTLGGYSVAYSRPRAQVGAISVDEAKAPILAFWQHGIGRSAAFLGELDGEISGELANWPGFGDFVTTLSRWLSGTELPAELFTELVREGHEGVLRVEAEDGAEDLLAELTARVARPDGSAPEIRLERVGERTLEARFPMRVDGVYQAALGFSNGGVLRVPPLTLPYSAEFEPQLDLAAGTNLLKKIAETTEGHVLPLEHELFEGARDSIGSVDLTRTAALLGLFALLLEIAVRRLGWKLPETRIAASLAQTLARKGSSNRVADKKTTVTTPSSLAEDRKPPSSAPAPSPPPPKDSIADMLGKIRKRNR